MKLKRVYICFNFILDLRYQISVNYRQLHSPLFVLVYGDKKKDVFPFVENVNKKKLQLSKNFKLVMLMNVNVFMYFCFYWQS
jgi:hypothetical protein